MSKLQNILNDIKTYNEAIYSSYGRKEKIDFSLTKKNWGTDVIPKEFWIDTQKKYNTRNNFVVENLSIQLKNSSGNEVTYPIKGTIIVKTKDKKDKHIYHIWTLDGRTDVGKTEPQPYDLILNK